MLRCAAPSTGEDAEARSCPPDVNRRALTLVAVDLTQANHERLADVCRRFGVTRLDLFGSVSRGHGHDNSDVDRLYELAPGAELGWEIEDLATALEDSSGGLSTSCPSEPSSLRYATPCSVRRTCSTQRHALLLEEMIDAV